MMNSDMELLRQYAERQSESAFETIVSRHINLVYSSALRQVRDPQLAKEITQAVFIILARKAGSLNPRTILPGWLYRTTRFTASNVVRSELSRQRREQEVQMQAATEFSPPENETVWREMAPLLDEAMARLGQADRDAILLRYFENKSLEEVGMALGIEERAAQKRVLRSVEKLRGFFARRGVALSATAIAGLLTAHSVHAAPAGLTGVVAAGAMVKGTAAGSSTMAMVKGGLKIMAWTKTKTAVVIGVALLFTGGGAFTAKKYFGGPNWTMTMENLNSLPPRLIFRPTKFPKENGGVSNGNNGKALWKNMPLAMVIAYAYDFPPDRIDFPPGFAKLPQKYDLMLSLDDHPREALQKQIEKQFHYTVRHESRDRKVFLLQVRQRDAAGLIANTGNSGSAGSYPGHFGIINQPISALRDYLSDYVGRTVVDDTGLTNRYDVEFSWKTVDELKEKVRNNLGLELVSGQEAVDTLVIRKLKN